MKNKITSLIIDCGLILMIGISIWAIINIPTQKPVPKLQATTKEYKGIIIDNMECDIKVLDCNKQTVLWWLKTLGVKHYKVAYAQSILESGTYTSKICKENNNLFGMRLAKKRNTTALGQRNGFAYYQDYIHSIMDYKLYQDYCFGSKLNEMSGVEYLRALQKAGYWEDSTYISKLQNVIKHEF